MYKVRMFTGVNDVETLHYQGDSFISAARVFILLLRGRPRMTEIDFLRSYGSAYVWEYLQKYNSCSFVG